MTLVLAGVSAAKGVVKSIAGLLARAGRKIVQVARLVVGKVWNLLSKCGNGLVKFVMKMSPTLGKKFAELVGAVKAFVGKLWKRVQGAKGGKVANRDEIIKMMKERPRLKVEEVTGDAAKYLEANGARASHTMLEDGTSHIIYTTKATKWDMMHEYMHYMYQNKWKRGITPGEDKIIESFLHKYKDLFKITPE